MGGYGKGLEYLQRMREERGIGEGNQREYMNQLWLTADGDIAIMRFVTDGGDIFVGQFHEDERTSRKGNKWKADVLCTEDEDCKFCKGGDRPWVKAVALVYVEAIDHKSSKEGWKESLRGTVKYFREDVGEFRIWMIKSNMQQPVMDKFGEFGSLVDVYHELRRYGAKGQGAIRYGLERTAIADVSPRCKEALASAPDIGEVVQQNFGQRKAGPRNIDAKEETGGFTADQPASADPADTVSFD